MKKVAVLYSGGSQWGGIETYLANLFRLYDRSRMSLVLVSLGEWELTKQLEHDGLSDHLEVLNGRRLRLKTVLDLRRVIADAGVDLLVSQGVVANAYARITALITGVPNLTVVHSNIDLDYPRNVTRRLYKLSDRVLRVGTTRYIAVSGYLKNHVTRSGVDPEIVKVVYNGVDTLTGPRIGKVSPDTEGDVLPPAPADETGPSAVAKDTFLLVSVGRLHPVKNFDSLVKAMQLLPENVRLTIWGEGGQRSHLEGLVAGLGLQGRVSLPGECESMSEALVGSDIYLQPSKSEGFGLAVTEAMLSAKPVVVAPYGGLVEQVEDRVTGIVARDGSPEGLAEAVQILLGDVPLSERLGLAGRERAEEVCSISRWLDNTTQALLDVPPKKMRRA